jgi:hypothetical protein
MATTVEAVREAAAWSQARWGRRRRSGMARFLGAVVKARQTVVTAVVMSKREGSKRAREILAA